MRRHFDLDDFAAPRLAENDPLAARSLGEAHHAARRPQKRDQVGDVIRPDVKDWTPAVSVKEMRVWMPVLVSGLQHEGGPGDRRADRAFIDEAADDLMAASHECIRCAAKTEAIALSELDQGFGLGHRHAKRLFGIDVLAG